MADNSHDIVNFNNGAVRLTKDGRFIIGNLTTSVNTEVAWQLAEEIAAVALGAKPAANIWTGLFDRVLVFREDNVICLRLYAYMHQATICFDSQMIWHIVKGFATRFARNIHRVTTHLEGDTMTHVSLYQGQVITTAVNDGDFARRTVLDVRESRIILDMCHHYAVTQAPASATDTQETMKVVAGPGVDDSVVVTGIRTNGQVFFQMSLTLDEIRAIAAAA